MFGTDTELRVGLIGTNWPVLAHKPAWDMLPNCKVTAICAANQAGAEAAAQANGIAKAYGDFRDLANDRDIDIVVVGTPPDVRFDIAMACLKAGKHVCNCLPFTTSADQATALLEAQKASSVVGIVDSQFPWLPAVRYMKDLIAEGQLGDVIQVTVDIQNPLFGHDGFLYPWPAYAGMGKPYPWLADARSGASAWRNFGSHALVCLVDLFGEVEEVIGEARTAVREWTLPSGDILEPDTFDTAMALMRMRSGAFANVNTGWSKADAACFRLEAWGTRGRILVEDTAFGEATTARIYYGDTRPRPIFDLAGQFIDIPSRYYEVPGTSLSKEDCPMRIQPLVAMLSDMAAAIRTGRDASTGFEQAAHAHRVVEAMERSRATRGWEAP